MGWGVLGLGLGLGFAQQMRHGQNVIENMAAESALALCWRSSVAMSAIAWGGE